MINGMIGKKVGMTRAFDEQGTAVPVTIVEVEPCTVVQIKKADGRDSYNAVQIGTDPVKLEKLTKPMQGHFKKAGLKEGYKILQEFRVDSTDGFEVGKQFDAADILKESTKVTVKGHSMGRGFQGGVRRFHFGGQPASHGVSKVHRKPMSAGSTDAARVFRGKRGPGHMGNVNATVQNVEIVKIKPAADGEGKKTYIVAIKGAIPGKANTVVLITKA